VFDRTQGLRNVGGRHQFSAVTLTIIKTQCVADKAFGASDRENRGGIQTAGKKDDRVT
jgi:hypothetical protein